MKAISQATLQNELIELFGTRTWMKFNDPEYVCPSLSWLNEFCAWLEANHHTYTVSENDCDNIALWAKVQATEALIKAKTGGQHEHTFGYSEVIVPADGNLNGIVGKVPFTCHGCNLVRTDDDVWRFAEAQTGRHCEVGMAMGLDCAHVAVVFM